MFDLYSLLLYKLRFGISESLFDHWMLLMLCYFYCVCFAADYWGCWGSLFGDNLSFDLLLPCFECKDLDADQGNCVCPLICFKLCLNLVCFVCLFVLELLHWALFLATIYRLVCWFCALVGKDLGVHQACCFCLSSTFKLCLNPVCFLCFFIALFLFIWMETMFFPLEFVSTFR